VVLFIRLESNEVERVVLLRRPLFLFLRVHVYLLLGLLGIKKLGKAATETICACFSFEAANAKNANPPNTAINFFYCDT